MSDRPPGLAWMPSTADDAAYARRVVRPCHRHPLVDRAARAKGLAVRDVPSAGSPAGRGNPQGRGGMTPAAPPVVLARIGPAEFQVLGGMVAVRCPAILIRGCRRPAGCGSRADGAG